MTTVGTLVENDDSGEMLLIPEDELKRIDAMGLPKCLHCGEPFEPRKGSGGKPQRFCKPECRSAFHADKELSEAERQRSQRSPTCTEKAVADAVASIPAAIRALEPPKRLDLNSYWSVPRQDEITCSATNEDTIEIEQVSPMGASENVRIDMHITNVVRFVRSVLYAAGFESVTIAAGCGGGWHDLVEGDTYRDITPDPRGVA